VRQHRSKAQPGARRRRQPDRPRIRSQHFLTREWNTRVSQTTASYLERGCQLPEKAGFDVLQLDVTNSMGHKYGAAKWAEYCSMIDGWATFEGEE